jgi:two-component system heavy metal sensor histidine kinase CusS
VLGFNQALDRVEIAYRQMESFNADVAHELRTPLATLINAAEVTLAVQRSPDALRETLAESLEELEQLKGLVNDMLFLARADQGGQAHGTGRVGLSDEARKTAEFYEALLSDTGLAIVIDGDAIVHCNAGLIRRALSNLLSNAIKQTGRGGTIRFGLRVERGFGVVEVTNPGAPIPDEIRTRMFDRFFRADPARSHRHAGHGLGLAIVRAIVEMHRGDVFARSDTSGNTVGFRIPVAL